MTADGTWTYTWDDEGNLVKKSKGTNAETWTYNWDERNELITVKRSQTDGGAIDRQEDFKYDIYQNRIEKSYDADGAGGGATVTRFAYDAWKNTNQHLVGNENWDVWADLNGSSSLTSRYLRGDVIDQVFARSDMGAKYWTLTDRLGSVRDVVNSGGAVKDTIAYNGFGEIISESDSNFRGRYAWTGREVEAEIDLQYNRARWYDANSGRWISQDPLGFDAGDSNLYRYVANAHTLFLDPTGLAAQVVRAEPRDSGSVEGLDKKVKQPAYVPGAEWVKSFLTARYSKDYNIAFKNPTDLGPIIYPSGKFKAKLGGVVKEFEAGTVKVVHHFVAFEWDICPDQNKFNEPITPTVVFDEIITRNGMEVKNVKNETPPFNSPYIRFPELKEKNGVATHRFIYFDAPGIPAFMKEFQGFPGTAVGEEYIVKFHLKLKDPITFAIIPNSSIKKTLTIRVNKDGSIPAPTWAAWQ